MPGLIGITVVDRYAALLWSKILPDLRVHEEVADQRGRRRGLADSAREAPS